MNQRLSWVGFSAGATVFIGTASEMINEHTQWSDFTSTPLGALHLFILGFAFCGMILGAFGIQLPRTNNPHGDRVTDKTLSDIQEKKNG